MEYVRAFCEEDIYAVAKIHAKIYFGSSRYVTDGLVDYYQKTFFQNPWYDQKYSSLVYCNEKGLTAGFMGRIVRPMFYDGKKVNVAVAHRLLADPKYASPYAAAMLVRKFLAGEQQMTISDGANDNAIRVWKAAGGKVSLLYSMNWFAPLRPFKFTVNMLSKKRQTPPALVKAALPFAGMFDFAVGKILGWNFKNPSPDIYDENIDVSRLFECVTEFTGQHRLRPDYDIKSLEWIYNALETNNHRGKFKGAVVLGKAGRRLGAFLYYFTPDKNCEVIFLVSHPEYRQTVLQHLLHYGYRQGAVGIIGRMEPDFIETFWQNNLFVKRGCWALVHSNDQELLDVIHRGQAYVSALEGELWLNSPSDRL